jgi:CRISPR-associated protein Csd1
MSWLQALYETYENCAKDPGLREQLTPVNHGYLQVHIEVVVDVSGNLRRARVVDKKEETLIPCTEESASRAGSVIRPHPLTEKLSYCAGDLADYDDSDKPEVISEYFEHYIQQLRSWSEFDKDNPKLGAIYQYLSKRTLIKDLSSARVIGLNSQGKLLTDPLESPATGSEEVLPLLKMLPKKGKLYDQSGAAVRFAVEGISGDKTPETWLDLEMQSSWMRYCEYIEEKFGAEERGLCVVSGVYGPIARLHAKRIRNPGDGGKLISGNDSAGYTYRGRFTDDSGLQACSINRYVSQKAHNALRWLISRQAYKKGEQVFVAWAKNGKRLPDPFKSTDDLFGDGAEGAQAERHEVADTGEVFANRLRKLISGYRLELGDGTGVVVMGLDSATPGRIAITYYREIVGSEFLERIETWHNKMAWPQPFLVPKQNSAKKFELVLKICAPTLQEIATVAFGERIDELLAKATVERLLPCIIDQRPIPRDLLTSVVKRVSNRVGYSDTTSWQRDLGVACSVIKGYWASINNKVEQRRYSMALEEMRTSRGYLYGRLLAFADHIEEVALKVAGEQRDTTAAKLTQRFSDRPYSTWRTIETSLVPYKARIKARWPGYSVVLLEQLDEIFAKFSPEDFNNDTRLDGEFLLGYHCQRQELKKRREQIVPDSESNNQIGE